MVDEAHRTQYKELAENMSDCVSFVDGSKVIQKARMIKTDWEISKIEEACKATEEAIVDTFATIKPGVTIDILTSEPSSILNVSKKAVNAALLA